MKVLLQGYVEDIPTCVSVSNNVRGVNAPSKVTENVNTKVFIKRCGV